MKYTENDLQLGDKLLCTKSEVDHWISGKMYELKLNNLGVLEVKDEDGDEAYSRYLLGCLNKEWDLVEFELIKEENNMQEFKVGDLVEVVKNNSHAYKNKSDLFQAGDTAVVTEVMGFNVRICEKGAGNKYFGNVISKHEIKKVEEIQKLTEYEEEELVLRFAEKIVQKNKTIWKIEDLKEELEVNETYLEKIRKEIKEITKKLLTK
ncbi:hypothetical protein [Enterococcus phage vB_EfaP_Efmus1]|uniref:Uncharacterized protein n=1 Tax=Enterococcus phage vB_EfaP_Efmus1 TaxID=2546625 RepID=A0A4D6DT03_9CAUD|nr:hypothetical protein H3T71_gp02 [Enterococcus phage vB_EfaP_Efmus1]QBZ69497.1 hypothetical protein [Enterococcus phage vB_EfaP_Efmus1]